MSNYDYYGNNDSWTVIIQKENDFETIRTQASIKEIKDLLSAFIRKDNAIDLVAYKNDSNATKSAEVSFSKGVLYAEGVERNGHIVRYTAVNENYVQDFKCEEYTAYVEEQSKSSADRYVVKPLTSKDLKNVEMLDAMSGFELEQWIEATEKDDFPFAWGIFDGDILAGYCSIGYADDTCSEIEEQPLYDSDSLLLSDVYVVPNYRHQGLAEKMVKTAIKKRWELDGAKKPVFLVCVSDRVAALYEKIGFTKIQKRVWSSAMVLVPEKGGKNEKLENIHRYRRTGSN